MRLKPRIERAEREMGLGQNVHLWVVILTARPAPSDPEYEARLRQRVERAIRQRPGEEFILLC